MHPRNSTSSSVSCSRLRCPSSRSVARPTGLLARDVRLPDRRCVPPGGPARHALRWRDADLAVGIGASWRDPAADAENIAWTRAYHAALCPSALPGGYVNFGADDDAAQVRANYQHNHDALVEVKRRYDPGNLLRLNQNIPPDAGERPRTGRTEIAASAAR
jgi:FAD/FMN-containing dehydrogenase